MSLPELLMVVGIAAIMMVMAFPKIAAVRDGAYRRAARQELTAAIAATRTAAFQKGKTATLTLTTTSATVTAQSGIAGNTSTILGPVRFDKTVGSSIVSLYGSPMTIEYNARGMLTPRPPEPLRYLIISGSVRDTVCISITGVIMQRGCKL